MAIKVNNTTVIDNSRSLTNIASLDAATVTTLENNLVVPTVNGTTGQVLTSNGTATPIWADMASTAATPRPLGAVVSFWWPQQSKWLHTVGYGHSLTSTSSITSNASKFAYKGYAHPEARMSFTSANNACYMQGGQAWLTTNGGTSWSNYSPGTGLIAYNGSNGSAIFYQGSSYAIYRSTNGGQSFSQSFNPNKYIYNFGSNATYSYGGAYNSNVSPSKATLYRSTDGFATATDISSSLPSVLQDTSVSTTSVESVAVANNGDVYIVGNYNTTGTGTAAKTYALFKSTDNGATWTELSGTDPNLPGSVTRGLSKVYAAGSTVVAVYPYSIVYSVDNGSTWSTVLTPYSPSSGNISIGGTNSNTIVLATTSDSCVYFEV